MYICTHVCVLCLYILEMAPAYLYITQRGSSSKCKEKILECAKREWDEWKKTLNDLGYENTPEYPYNTENLGVYCAAEVAEAVKRFGPLPP